MKNNKLRRGVAICLAVIMAASMVSCGDKKGNADLSSTKSTTANVDASTEDNVGFTQEAVQPNTSSSGEDSDLPDFMQGAELKVLKKYVLSNGEYEWIPNKLFSDSDYSGNTTVLAYAFYFPNASSSSLDVTPCHLSGEEYNPAVDICELDHFNFQVKLADGGSLLIKQFRFDGIVNPEDIAFSVENYSTTYFISLSDTTEVGTDYINTVVGEHKLDDTAGDVKVVQWHDRDFLVTNSLHWVGDRTDDGRCAEGAKVSMTITPFDFKLREKPAESDFYVPDPSECGLVGDYTVDQIEITSNVHSPKDGEFSWSSYVDFTLNSIYTRDESLTEGRQETIVRDELKEKLPEYYVVLKDGDSEVKLPVDCVRE